MKKRIIGLLLSIVMIVSAMPIALAESANPDTKISKELQAMLDSPDFESAYITIFINDLDHDYVMNEFRCLYPEDYQLYNKAENDNEYSSDIINADIKLKDYLNSNYHENQNDEMLQLAIEHKRAVYRNEYSQHNISFLDEFPQVKALFVSEYAPFIIAEADRDDIVQMGRCDCVVSIDAFTNEKSEMEDLGLANSITRADYVRDTYGNDGSGVKIGIVEANGVPNVSDSYLTSANIIKRSGDTTTDTHATKVARILVGTDINGNNDGLAPAATLYCCIGNNDSSFYSGIEWLVSCGVNVINASLGWSSTAGQYDTRAKWIDHIAVQHDVHFVKSAGNNGGLITSPGMAYNAITVGGINPNNSTTISDFEFCTFSSYQESGTIRAEKPNLVAPCTGFWGSDGTSFAAPQVTGTIAQLCSYKNTLKTKQAAMGAILAASAANKVECVGNGEKGDVFANTPSNLISSSNLQISNKVGAGILDSRWARGIAYYGHYWSYTIAESSFPYTKTVTINASGNSLTRVAIFWLKRNSISGTHASSTSGTFFPYTNLNLEIFDPDGHSVGKSQLLYSNFEIVQFVPTKTGTYQIKITCPSTCNDKEHVGIAVW